MRAHLQGKHLQGLYCLPVGALYDWLLTKGVADGCGVSKASNEGYAQNTEDPVHFWDVDLPFHLFASVHHLHSPNPASRSFCYNGKQMK